MQLLRRECIEGHQRKLHWGNFRGVLFFWGNICTLKSLAIWVIGRGGRWELLCCVLHFEAVHVLLQNFFLIHTLPPPLISWAQHWAVCKRSGAIPSHTVKRPYSERLYYENAHIVEVLASFLWVQHIIMTSKTNFYSMSISV